MRGVERLLEGSLDEKQVERSQDPTTEYLCDLRGRAGAEPSARRYNRCTSLAGEPVTAPLLPTHYRDRVAALSMAASRGGAQSWIAEGRCGDVHANGIVSIGLPSLRCKRQVTPYKMLTRKLKFTRGRERKVCRGDPMSARHLPARDKLTR